jgi:hypothetical protein
MRELSSAPQGHLFELLVPPGAERRGNQEFAAQLAHSPRSEAEGGTLPVSCGPQGKAQGLTPKACAVGRQIHWVVRCGAGTHPAASSPTFLRSATSPWDLGTASSCHLRQRGFGLG